MKIREPLKNSPHLGAAGVCFHRLLLLVCLLVFGLGISSQAQNTLNVTNYGAIGDAVQFFVNTSSNAFVFTTTNQIPNSAIGEAIEVFGAGVPTTSVNNQDMVATITNIVNGTNIYVSQYCGKSLTNAFATYGHNNDANFQAVIAAVGADTNDTIYIPAGTYLFLPASHSGIYGYSCIVLRRGGINFVGAGTNSTILLSQGAWGLIGGALWRGFLVQVASPITNNFPVSFSYLTMDGGVLQGNTSNHGFPASIIDGTGWDITHDAFLKSGIVGISLYYEYFTNVLVQHWRGEEFKSVDGSTNGQTGIYNCTFTDGNATALNVYPAWNVRSNLFANLFQIAEYYQAYSIYPGYFENNICTNITGNGFAINGGKGSNPSFNIIGNTFRFSNGNGIETTPGDNILIESNLFIAGGGNAIVLGVPGYQGTFDNSNIVITANTFSNVSGVLEIVGFPPNDITHVRVYNNSIIELSGGKPYALINNGYATDFQYYSNSFSVSTNTSMILSQGSSVPFVLINTNNLYYYRLDDLPNYSYTGTNYISYATGPNYVFDGFATAGLTFALVDTNASEIPTGAQIQIFNNNNNVASVRVYLSSSLYGSSVIIPRGQTDLFYWLAWNHTWSTNGALVSGPLLDPPANFGPNY